jgi:transcriptional regulator with XRE-family HTH domain
MGTRIGAAVDTRAAAGRARAADLLVTRRLRERRLLLGLSQTELAKRLGISTQQLYKYEAGANRIAAGQLWKLAQALSVDIDFSTRTCIRRRLANRRPSAWCWN